MSTIYPANWRVPSGVKLRGFNLLPCYTAFDNTDQATGTRTEYQIAESFSAANWPTHLAMLTRSIKQAADLGANVIRLWTLAPEGASDYGGAHTYYTAQQHAQHAVQIAAACAENGVYFYPTAQVGTVYGSPLLTQSQLENWITILVTALKVCPNVIGIDCQNETLSTVSGAILATYIAASHSADSTLPATVSYTGLSSSSMWAQVISTEGVAAGVDYLDVHVYYDFAPADMAGLESYTTQPILIGEIGSQTNTAGNIAARWAAGSDATLRPSCAGALAWSINGGGPNNAAYDFFGTEYVSATGQRYTTYAPRVPTVTGWLSNFSGQNGGTDARWLKYPRSGGSTSGWAAKILDTIYPVNSSTGVTSSDSGGGGAFSFSGDLLGFPDGVYTAILNTAAADSASNHYAYLLLGVDLWTYPSDAPNCIAVGYTHYVGSGSYTPGWQIGVFSSNTLTQLATSAFAMTPGSYELAVTVSGNGSKLALAVNGTTVIGTQTLAQPITASRLGYLVGGNSTSPIYFAQIGCALAYPVTAEVLGVAAVGSTSASFTVTGGSGVASRQLYVYTVSGSPLTSLLAVAGATGTAPTVTGLTSATASYLSLLSTDGSGHYARSNEVQVTPIPGAGQVLQGVAIGATTGSVVLPSAAQVESGVAFGPASDLTGTYSGGGGGGGSVTDTSVQADVTAALVALGYTGGLAVQIATNLNATVASRTTGSLPAYFSSMVVNPANGGVILAGNGLDGIQIETGINARQALSPILAFSAGILSGATTGNITIYGGANPSTTRIAATTDGNGNRTSVTLNLPT